MAVTAASTANEDAMSTGTGLGQGSGAVRGATPSAADTSCTNGKLPFSWHPKGPMPQQLAAPLGNYCSRGWSTPPRILCRAPHLGGKKADSSMADPGRGHGLSLLEQVTAKPTNANHLASLSSYEEVDEGHPMKAAAAIPDSSPHKGQRQARNSMRSCVT